MLKCDLHVHTKYSRDGESSVEDIIRMAEKRGLDVIAITDHDTVGGAKYAQTIKTDIMVIPGVEISTKSGHLIALGITETIPAGLDFYETVDRAREMGAFLILPHPFHQFRHGVGTRLKDAIGAVDAVESFNSRYIIGSANKKAEKKAKKFKKPCVAGSDAHNARFVGYGVTVVDSEKDMQSIFDAISAGRVCIIGKMTPLKSYTGQSLKNTKRKIVRKVRHK
ncbi:PHP domain protein [Methanolacinia petrolearia DSM 11571]|uniref:PHP domain protein n=1 Tax=Methanolacinia petrolearia (strain DSM 11571 / OCM 486 / SEBR 4847) TaxID=679926 RepID=E1RHM9_METP4|nr:PHP domain-containing protein [Methanolacinia petrolearia]ADN35338.1 PHP domain protein [Methanolacinia petrolearia DSM 11571]